jgi:hypothetical protein
MSLIRDTESTPRDAHDLVAAIHRHSIQELERLARAERARMLGHLVAAAIAAVVRLARSVAHLSRTQLAKEEASYRSRRSLPIGPLS